MAFRKGGKGTSRDAGDTRSSFPITQAAHGFVVPQAVYLDDADDTYKLAKADDIDTANAIGIVSSVENVNNFTITTAGVNNFFTGLTEGLTFYVSASTAGALTSTRPDIARPILNALSTTRAVIFVDAISQNLSGNGLPYVVGLANGAIEYQFNTIQSAIDAVEAAGADDNAIIVMPGIYTEDLTIVSTILSISSLGNDPDIVFVVGDVTITSAAPISNSTVSISGLTIAGSLTTAGSLRLILSLQRFRIGGTGTKVFDWGNTNTNSVLTAINSFFLVGGTATAAIERTAGSPSVVLTDILVEGNFDFSAIAGGSIEATNLIVNDGSIDISNTTLSSKFFNLIVNTVGANPALDIATAGACEIIGGFLNVPSGGNAITPATGADFTFTNVATTSGTLLTTAMGTRLETDGVTLKSDGNGLDDFLNDSGSYSAPKTIYTSNGTVLSNRVIEIPEDRNLNIQAFNSTLHSNSIREGQLILKADLVLLLCKVLDGAGNTVTFEGIELTASGMLVTDSTNTTGLKYAADYSANFTDRSLIDKAYVDANPTIFTSNGAIFTNRIINLFNSSAYEMGFYDAGSQAAATKTVMLASTPTSSRMTQADIDTGVIQNRRELILSDADGMLVTDTTDEIGLIYAADYSANFTDRSLVDKAYTDQGFLSRTASATSFTSAGKPILAVTDSSADRTVTIATADIEEGRQFIVKDEDGLAGTNMITVTTPTISVTSVAAGSSGSDFLTSTVHGYAIGQVVIHAGFADGDYNGKFTVTDIVSTTRYEIAVITFVATGTGTSNIAIDGQASFIIGVDYGSIEFYCNDNQVFTKGAGNLAPETINSTTGLLEGGVVSLVVPGSPFGTTLDITALKGNIVDTTDPLVPVVTRVKKDAVDDYEITAPSLAEDGVYIIGCDVNGDIVEILLADLVNSDRQDYILFGIFAISSGVAFTATPLPLNLGYDGATTSQDFMRDVIGPANIDGNVISSNDPSTNLRLDNDGGSIFLLGSNFRNSTQVPNERVIPSDTELTFFRVFRESGSEQLDTDTPAGTQDPNATLWDDGSGMLAAAGTSKFYIHVLYISRIGQYILAYPQIQYDTLANAQDALNEGAAFEEYPTLQVMVQVAFFIFKGGVTTFSNPNTAQILRAPKFRLTNDMLKV